MKIKTKLYTVMSIIIFLKVQLFAIETVIQGRVDEMYDDNIKSSASAPESDWITNLMAGLAFKSESRVLDFALSGNIYQRFYINNSDDNINYQDLSLLINKNFTETVFIKITDVFQHYPDPDNYGTMFGRNDNASGYISNLFTTAFSAYVTKELFFDVFYKNRIMKNDNDAMTDTELHNPGGDFGYSFNSANILKAGYLYTLMKYENGNETTGHRGYGEYEKYFTKQTRVIIHGGYDYIMTSEGATSASRWMVSLIDDVDLVNQLNITYVNENTISEITNDTFKNWRITASYKRELTNRIKTDLSLFYGKGIYEMSNIENNLAGASAKLSLIINDFINFNAGYNYTWNKTTIPLLPDMKYHRNQVSAGLSAMY